MYRRALPLVVALLALTGCDASQPDGAAPEASSNATFALALEDGPMRYVLESEGWAETAFDITPENRRLQFSMQVHTEAEQTERHGVVRGVIDLGEAALAPGVFEAGSAQVLYMERRDGAETRYAFNEADFRIALEVVTEDRLEGHYQASADASSGRASVSGSFSVAR